MRGEFRLRSWISPKLALRLPEVFERVTKRHVRKFLRFSAMRSYVSSGIVDLSVTEFLRD